jgi:hypothetical protein
MADCHSNASRPWNCLISGEFVCPTISLWRLVNASYWLAPVDGIKD